MMSLWLEYLERVYPPPNLTLREYVAHKDLISYLSCEMKTISYRCHTLLIRELLVL